MIDEGTTEVSVSAGSGVTDDTTAREPARVGGPSGSFVLRELNTAEVLAALRHSTPLTISALARVTGLSRPAVRRALDDLETALIARPSDHARTASNSVGRPARQYEFAADAGHVIGIDAGAGHVRAIVTDLAGTIVSESEHTFSTGRTPTVGDLIAQIDLTAKAAWARAAVATQTPWAIGLGVPGRVDPRTGAADLSPTFSTTGACLLDAQLARRFRCPIFTDNDANLAGIAERWRGAATDADSIVYVHWGSRIGAGIIIDGKVRRGANWSAGELGFVDLYAPGPTSPEPEPGRPRTRGPFESLVTTQSVVALARQRAAATGDQSLLERLMGLSDVDAAAMVFSCALAGEDTAVAVVETIVAIFSRGIAVLQLILDPDCIVIGGSLARSGAPLRAALIRHTREHVFNPPPVRMSQLGNDAVALGAIRQALDHVDQTIIPRILRSLPAHAEPSGA